MHELAGGLTVVAGEGGADGLVVRAAVAGDLGCCEQLVAKLGEDAAPLVRANGGEDEIVHVPHGAGGPLLAGEYAGGAPGGRDFDGDAEGVDFGDVGFGGLDDAEAPVGGEFDEPGGGESQQPIADRAAGYSEVGGELVAAVGGAGRRAARMCSTTQSVSTVMV